MKNYENDYVYLADRIKKKDRIRRVLSPLGYGLKPND